MIAKENATEEKAIAWRLIERIHGQTEAVVKHRPDWRTTPKADTSVLMTFSKTSQLFYDVSKKDLELFASYRRAFIIFLVGSHKDVFIVPTEVLSEHIESHGLNASQEYGDYKLHLIRDYRGSSFRELPSLNLAPYFNQYAQLL